MDVQGAAEDHQGDITTDESEDEVSHYASRRKEVLDTASQVAVPSPAALSIASGLTCRNVN